MSIQGVQTKGTSGTPTRPVQIASVDPARRPDVLLRVRREQGQEVSVWWNIGAFLGVSVAVIALLSLVPGGA